MRITVYIFVFFALLGQGCLNSDDAPGSQCILETVAQQNSVIDNYIADINMPMQVTASGLRYSIDSAGTGDNVVYGDSIEVAYQGALLDSTIFDQGVIGPPTYPIFQENSFIPGFEEGLLLLNEGAWATFILPGELAYGCFPPQGSIIGENEILIFKINMVSVNP